MHSPDQCKGLPAISENSPAMMRQGTRIKKICLGEEIFRFYPETRYPQ
jgi:hypothetical protein